jgi:hypothetical protein
MNSYIRYIFLIVFFAIIHHTILLVLRTDEVNLQCFMNNDLLLVLYSFLFLFNFLMCD